MLMNTNIVHKANGIVAKNNSDSIDIFKPRNPFLT